MAIPNQTDAIKDADKLAEEAGQNAPLTPMGAQEIGATPDQSKMMGTPAQKDAALRQQQKQQEDVQAKLAKEEEQKQARLEGATLQQAQRYASPAQEATLEQQRAKEISESLRVFGPVQTRVQALIQERITSLQGQKTSLQVNQDAIDALPEESQEKAIAAIQAYIDSPSEDTIQAIYDAVGYANLENIPNLFAGEEASVSAAMAPILKSEDAVLGSLDLGIDEATKASLEKALGIEDLNTLSLGELNAQIQALEAQEFSEIDRLQAILSDPNASPTLQQQARDQLAQMGVVGVTGTEERVDTVIDQVERGDTLNILGRKMTLEQALGDDGISDIITKAVNDPDLLQDMKDTEEYKDLAGWIEDNIETLKEAVGEAETASASFLEVQDNYKDFVNTLGEGEKETAALKAMFPGFDFSNSLLSSEWESLKALAEINPLYSIAKDDVFFANSIKQGGTELLNKFTESFLPEGYDDFSDILKKASSGDAAAIEALKTMQGSIQASVDFSREFAESSTLKKIFGEDYLGEDGYLFTDLPDLTVYNNIKENKPKILTEVSKYLDDKRFGDTPEDAFDALEDLYNIQGDANFSAAEIRKKVYDDLDSQKEQKQQLKEKGITANSSADDIHGYLFNTTDFSALDLNYALESMDEDAKKLILDIFDQANKDVNEDGVIDEKDKDGVISEQELNDDKLYARLVEAFGIDKSAADIIDQKGGFADFNDLLMGVVNAGTSKNGYAKAATKELGPVFSSVNDDGSIANKAYSKEGQSTYLGMYTGDKTGIPDTITPDYTTNLAASIREYVGDTKNAMERVWPVGDRDWFDSKISEFSWNKPAKALYNMGATSVDVPAINFDLVNSATNLKTSDIVDVNGNINFDKLTEIKSNLDTLRNQTASRYAWLTRTGQWAGSGGQPSNWRTQKDDLMNNIEPKIDAARKQIQNLIDNAEFKNQITSYTNTRKFQSNYSDAAKKVNNISALLSKGEGASNANVKKAVEALKANPFAVKLLSEEQKAIVNKHLKYFGQEI